MSNIVHADPKPRFKLVSVNTAVNVIDYCAVLFRPPAVGWMVLCYSRRFRHTFVCTACRTSTKNASTGTSHCDKADKTEENCSASSAGPSNASTRFSARCKSCFSLTKHLFSQYG